MNSDTINRMVDQLYGLFNELEAAVQGPTGLIKSDTMAKLREILLRAKANNNQRLYRQARRVYNRLLTMAGDEDPLQTPEELARHVEDLVLEVLDHLGWLRTKPQEDIGELREWLREILQHDFEDSLEFGLFDDGP